MTYYFSIVVNIAVILLLLDRVRARGFDLGWRTPVLLVCLLAPMWFETRLGAFLLDPRVGVGLTACVCYFLKPVAVTPRFRILPSDIFLIVQLCCMGISDIVVQQFSPLYWVGYVMRWSVPYFLGRIALTRIEDLQECLTILIPVGVLLSFLAFLEGVTQFNFWELTASRSYRELDPIRWGLKRANMNQTHPIYFGLTLVGLLPWLLEGARWARRGWGPKWWAVSPYLLIPGIIATGSRSAQILALIVVTANIFWQFPRLRATLVTAFIAAGLTFLAFRAEILDVLSQYAGEVDPNRAKVTIRGTQYPYSGTLHRDLLGTVYEAAIERRGWWGFGGERIDMPKDSDIDERFISVDDHYLMFSLQFGLVGIIVFVIFTLAGLGNIIRVLIRDAGPFSGLLCTLFGYIFGMLLVFRGVWFAHDYGWWWIFSIGIGAGVLSRSLVEYRPETFTTVPNNFDAHSPHPHQE